VALDLTATANDVISIALSRVRLDVDASALLNTNSTVGGGGGGSVRAGLLKHLNLTATPIGTAVAIDARTLLAFDSGNVTAEASLDNIGVDLGRLNGWYQHDWR
jgi:hypothetical protein